MLTEEDLLQLSGSETAHASPNASAVAWSQKFGGEEKKQQQKNGMKSRGEKEKETTAFAFTDGINDRLSNDLDWCKHKASKRERAINK